MMSILLRPEFEPQYASMLTLVMGLSVAQAVRNWMSVSIKWPNDVVVSRKKICGILTEMGLENGKIREVIIGIGINVNLEEIRRTSKTRQLLSIWKLERNTTKPCDRADHGEIREELREVCKNL